MKRNVTNPPYMTFPSAPNLSGFIDQDILDRFKDSAVTYDCIINAQLIKTMRELIEVMKMDLSKKFNTNPTRINK